jgi:hypothetical protein
LVSFVILAASIFVNTSFSFIPSIKLSIRSSTWFIYDDRSPPCLASARAILFCCRVRVLICPANTRTSF